MIDPKRYWVGVGAIILIGLVIRYPAITAGFGMDDYAQLAMLDGVYPVHRAPWDLFRFSSGDPREVETLIEHGSLAWWSHPQLRLAALRPLSSLTMWFDVQAFGNTDATWHHVHSFLWWIGLIVAAAALLRRLLPDNVALLALLLYALDECHAHPIGWLANRNSIISAAFGFLALWGHVRWRREGWRPGRWVMPGALALSLAGGEYALCIGVYLVMFELIAVRGPWAERLRALWPAAAVFGVYFALHRLGGYGSYGSAVYVDPLREPLNYLAAAGLRGPILIADMLLAVPTGKLAFYPAVQKFQALGGPIALVVFGLLMRGIARRVEPEDRRICWWLFAAAVLSLLPVTSSFVSARLLIVPGLAGHAVVAMVIVDGVRGWRRQAGRRRIAGVVAAAYLLLAHVVLATITGWLELGAIGILNRNAAGTVARMQFDPKTVGKQRLVVVAVTDPMTLLYPRLIMHFQGKPMPRSWWVMSMAPKHHRLHRTGKRVLELEVVDGAMVAGPVERLFRRRSEPFAVGQVVKVEGLAVEILKLRDGNPTRVRFTFDRSVDHPSIQFILATPAGLIRYPMGPVGATMAVPPPALPVPPEFWPKR